MKTRLLSILLAVSMMLALLPAGALAAEVVPDGEDPLPPTEPAELETIDNGISPLADADYAGGSGTEDDPWLIETGEQFAKIDYKSVGYFRQTANFKFEGTIRQFMRGCVYDGDGYQIFAGSRTKDLFANNYGTIKNLHVKCEQTSDGSSGSDIVATSVTWRGRGGIAHWNNEGGTILNCSVSGSVSSGSYTGGIASINYGTISGCVNYAAVESRQAYTGSEPGCFYAGGIAGKNNGMIENCYSPGSVTSYFCAGAITGECIADGCHAKNCYMGPDMKLSSQRAEDMFLGHTSSSFELNPDNCYIVGGDTDGSDYAVTVSEEDFRGQNGVDLLNNGGSSVWETDQYGINNGFPVLAWENALHPSVEADHPSDSYMDPFDVVLSSPGGGVIRYTLDGSLPSSDSPEYTGPIPVPEGDTKLYAQVEGEQHIVEYNYSVKYGPIHPDKEPGVYPEPFFLHLNASQGGVIYYTTDGSSPVDSSRRFTYDSYIIIEKTTTIIAAARRPDNSWGDLHTYKYIISPEILPSPSESTQPEPFSVTLSCDMDGVELYYTTDGSKPSENGKLYTGPIWIAKTTDLKVESKIDGVWSEDVKVFHYVISEVPIQASSPSGEYSEPFTLTLTYQAGYDLAFLVSLNDGEFRPYADYGDAGLEIYEPTKVTAQLRSGDTVVSELILNYTLPTPVITPSLAAGAYTMVKEVSLTCDMPAYDIYYTLDGQDPWENGTLYTAPFRLDRSASLKICAMYKGKRLRRSGQRFDYTFTDIAQVSSDKYGNTSYTTPISVTLSCSASGYQILYTLDGSDPAVNGILYTEPVVLERTTELRAVPVRTIGGEKIFGAVSAWKYVLKDLLTVKELQGVPKSDGYVLSCMIENRFHRAKDVLLCVAEYNAGGQMLNAQMFPAVTVEEGRKFIERLYTPKDREKLSIFRVFALEDETMVPLCESKEFRVFSGITVSQNSLSGYYRPGNNRSETLSVTAHYTDGTSRVLSSSEYTITSSNETAVGVSGSYVIFKKPGKSELTVSYAEGGVSQNITIQAETVMKYYASNPSVPDFCMVWDSPPDASIADGYAYRIMPGINSASDQYIELLRELGFSQTHRETVTVTFQKEDVQVGFRIIDSYFYILVFYPDGYEGSQFYSRFPDVPNPQWYLKNLFMSKQGVPDTGSYSYMYSLPSACDVATYLEAFRANGYTIEDSSSSDGSDITLFRKGNSRVGVIYNSAKFALMVTIM